MSGYSTNMNIPIPTAGTDQFSWETYLRDAFNVVDKLKVFGSTKIYNAAEYATFKAALAALPVSGGTLIVPPGDYEVDQTDYAEINGKNNIYILGLPGSRIVMSGANQHAVFTLLTIRNCANVKIEGLTLVGALSSNPENLNTGIHIYGSGCRNVHIRECTIEDVGRIPIRVSTEGGAHDVEGPIWIDSNRIIGYQGSGIHIHNIGNIFITNNYIYRDNTIVTPTDPLLTSLGYGIQYVSGDGTTNTKTCIESNQVINPRWGGVYVTETTPVVGYRPGFVGIENNSFSGGVYGVVVANLGDADHKRRIKIAGNMIYNPTQYGISVGNNNFGLVINNNVIRLAPTVSIEYLISVGQSDYVVISNNTCECSDATALLAMGISLNSCDQAIVTGNSIINCGDNSLGAAAIKFVGDYGIIANNIITNLSAVNMFGIKVTGTYLTIQSNVCSGAAFTYGFGATAADATCDHLGWIYNRGTIGTKGNAGGFTEVTLV